MDSSFSQWLLDMPPKLFLGSKRRKCFLLKSTILFALIAFILLHQHKQGCVPTWILGSSRNKLKMNLLSWFEQVFLTWFDLTIVDSEWKLGKDKMSVMQSKRRTVYGMMSDFWLSSVKRVRKRATFVFRQCRPCL